MLAAINRGFTRITDFPDFGKLLLRVTIAGLMLFHGVSKAISGISWINDLLISHNLPGFIAYGVYIGEIVAPILIILGIFTRPSAFIFAINIIIATCLIGLGKLTTITAVGAWGLEIEALFIIGGLAVMFLGSGRFSVMRNPDYR